MNSRLTIFGVTAATGLLRPATLAGAIGFGIFVAAAGPRTAKAQSLCENYLVLPTGEQVCFDNSPVVRDRLESEFPDDGAESVSEGSPTTALSALDADFSEGYVAYLSQLESCTPSTTELPLPNTPDTWIRMTIQGDDGAGCAVDMALVDLETDAETPYLNCVYSPETLAVITDPIGYAQATGLDAGTVADSEGSTSARNQALSEAVATECSI